VNFKLFQRSSLGQRRPMSDFPTRPVVARVTPIWQRLLSLIVVVLLAAASGIGVSSAGAAPVNSDHPVWSSLATLAQVEADLAKASTQTSLTSTEIAGLQAGYAAPDAQENGKQQHCEVNNEVAFNFAPCVYGDTSSTKVIAVVGDSEADMWIPTFDIWGKEYGFKIDRIVMDGCSAWQEKPPASVAGWAACEVKWKAYCVSEILKLHPFAVVATGLLEDSQPTQSAENPTTAAKGIDKYFKAIEKSNAKLFVLSNIPWDLSLSATPEACVEIHTSDIRACDPTFNETMTATLKVVKKVGIATVIPIGPLYCSSGTCPVVAGEDVLYSDSHHMGHVWAVAIPRAFSQIFNPLLGIK
jgi:hypothetical protein